MSEQLTTDQEHSIIDALSFAINHTEHSLGLGDNAWLRSQIEGGPSDDKLKVAVEIAVAFLHFSQDKKAQLTCAQSRVDGLVDHIKQLEAEVAELRAIKFRRFQNEDCWVYQGDGEDHLENLVCPVVMSAQQVMEFEKAQSRVAELERQNSNLAMLVQRLVRRSLHFDAGCRVAKQALDYLVRNNLMPSVLRGEVIDEQ